MKKIFVEVIVLEIYLLIYNNLLQLIKIVGGDTMKYFGQGNDYVDVQCNICGKVLKISKAYCKEEKDKYNISLPIKCICGSESSEIIK